jgi:hypothetical protein
MTELLTDMLQSEIFWKAVAAIVAAIWSLPAVQWFRRELREHRMGVLLDAARDVGTSIYREARDDMLQGKLSPDEVRQRAVRHLRGVLENRAPRLLKRVGQAQLERLIDEVFDEKEAREAQKPPELRDRWPVANDTDAGGGDDG